MLLYLLWIVVIAMAICLFYRQTYTRFCKFGVNGPRPVPFFGTMTRVIFKMDHFADYMEKVYNFRPEDRFIATYEFLRPLVILRDLELIKKITIKDFDHFVDHRSIVDGDIEPFFGKSLFAMKGQKWRDMRSTLSPAFTSSKIRAMVPFMVEVGEQMTDALKRKLKSSKSEYVNIEVKDLATRYANDVIASCAFGLKVDSHVEQNNKFHRMGKAITTLKFWTFIKLLGYLALPSLMKKLRANLFSQEVQDFFKELALGTIKNREENNIVRPDMIQLLMDAKKGKLRFETHDDTKDIGAGFATAEESSVGRKQINRVWDDMDLIGQAVVFFVAGFETVSAIMAFLTLELAVNTDIQDKLYQEIRAFNDKNGGKFDYTSIQSMTYLDMVVSEVLRLWPPAPFTDRLCVKDYNLGKANDKAEDYIVYKDEVVNIPVWAIHRDPEYFPNPTKFDPERFSPENVHNIKPFTYLPFGLGPRNCIGSRFALCEIKVMVYKLLLNMEVSPGEKLYLPIQLSMEPFNMKAKGGHWVQIRPRKQE